MKKVALLVVILAVAFSVAGCSGGGGGISYSKEIDDFVNRFLSYLEDENATGLASLYADPLTVVTDGIPTQVTREQVRATYELAFTFITVYSVNLTDKSVTLSGEQATVSITFDNEYSENNGPRQLASGWQDWLLQRIGGKWYIIETTGASV